MSSPNNQRPRRSHQQVDRISNLPDTIIWHILSLVPTKTAVKTSVLSSRWKFVWTKVPVLDFTELPKSQDFYTLTSQQKISFRSFVDRVLIHNDVSSVWRLCFDLSTRDEVQGDEDDEVQGDEDDFYLKSWLNAITRREFREISIRFHGHIRLDPVLLPSSFLCCESLVVLRLGGKVSFCLSISLNLPNLEIVELDDLELPVDDFIKKLSSGCPALKELHVRCCDITSTLHIESPTLVTLILAWIMFEPRANMVIKAPNLQHLHFQDTLTDRTQYEIGSLSSLVEATLVDNIYDHELLLKLLRIFCGVKSLQIGYSVTNCFGSPGDDELPMFPNLTFLKIIGDYSMLHMLKFAPNLMHLIVEIGDVRHHSFSFPIVPSCLLILPKIEIENFWGFTEGMNIVRYFLNSALALKEFVLHMHFGHHHNDRTMLLRQRDVLMKLLTFPRASSTCEVRICKSCHRPRFPLKP